MRIFMKPLDLFGLNTIATAALAGVVVALLGTLAGMVALWDLTCAYFDESSAWRAVFYMLIFPSAFFFAQVYTEGMFIGLAFGSLALLRRKHWFWAGVLAFIAAWTRAHGALLFIPLLIAWLRAADWKNLPKTFSWQRILQAGCVLLPLASYLLWRYSSLGIGWEALQSFYFGRGLLTVDHSIVSWMQAYQYATSKDPALIYFLIEVGSVILALAASLALFKKSPEIAAFSLAIVAFSALSGSAQSQVRYMLVAPALFMVLAWLGRDRTFDRAWIIFSVLLMGMLVMLFSFDMWVG
jgi:hypothetical protein